MAEQLPPQDRLQPALLDRLTDEEPEKKLEPRELRVLSKNKLRQAVLRDLAWLFNATRLEAGTDLAKAPFARRSVINFGLPAFSGTAASSLDITDLTKAIRQAILDYEPRILPSTLQVRAVVDAGQLDHHNVVGVEIRGQLWAQPVPLELLVRTEIDLETGKVEIADLLPRPDRLTIDTRLLQYYNLELQHLREMGAEFAQQFPKIAGRLGINGLEVVDPYVERLLEGVGFLAARVQLKLDAEFPRFTQALLEIVLPHYLAPTPSMLVAQLKPDPNEPNLANGFTVPRARTLVGLMGAEDATACEFRTAHDVTLWPLEIASASYFSFAPDLPLNSLPIARRIKGGLRIRLKATAGLKLRQTSLDSLHFYLARRDDVANKLYELCLSSTLGVLAVPSKGASRTALDVLPATSVGPVGSDDDEALLPVTVRSFHGYRLLQEYFAFPQRYRFFEMSGLSRAMKRVDGDEIELVVLLGRGDPTLESVVDASNFALFCTPAVNLFPKRADRIHVTDGAHEYHVVADRTRPMDFEVYEVTEVVGHGIGSDSEQQFLPFYAAYSTDESGQQSAYFTTRREPRLPSAAQKRRGSRSSYIGTEVFLGIVDAAQAPFSGDLRQLSIQTLCTNRDLVLQMPVGLGKSDFSLDVAAPLAGIRVVSGPSRPLAPLADGAVSWRAISHLSLNYLSLVNSTEQEGAAALRDLLELYAPSTDASARRQIDGVRSVQVKPVVRRLPMTGPLAFGRGLEIGLNVDELAFEGGSAYLLGAVLDRYFARYVSINSFTETVLRSGTRGEINRWRPHWGARPTL